MKFLKKLDESLEEWILGALLIGMCLVLITQILMRISGYSLTWAEELARYFYVWSVFLSLGCCIRGQYELKVELILDYLPKAIRKVLKILLDVLNIVLFAYLAYYAVSTVQGIQASGQTSPAMEIPSYIIYSIIPVGFALASLRSVQRLYFDVTGKGKTKSVDPATSA